MMFKAAVHPFYYPEQAVVHPEMLNATGEGPIYTVPGMAPFVENSKVVHFTASTFIDTGVDLRKKKVVMQHGGHTYRMSADNANKIYNDFVDATVIQMPDLLGLGAKNEHLIYFPVDTDFIKPTYDRKSKKLIIGHFPSIPKYKGSEQIKQLMGRLKVSSLKDKFIYCGPKLTESYGREDLEIWLEHLQRVSYCDVIIDVFCDDVQGRQYGEWGNASFEAAAMGKIVITNSLKIDTYREEYGDCELCIANDLAELEAVLRKLIAMNDSQIFAKQINTRSWVEKKHSIPATAKRLWDKVYKEFY